MKKNGFYFIPTAIIILLLFSLNSFSQQNGSNQEINNAENVILAIAGNSLPCTVDGRCEGYFCSASIECGCDETPKCECSWVTCKCDCEKKGRIGVILYPEYTDIMNSLKQLVLNNSNSELNNISSDIDLVLQSVEERDYSNFIYNSQKLYDDVHSLKSTESKDLINHWFSDKNIDDEI